MKTHNSYHIFLLFWFPPRSRNIINELITIFLKYMFSIISRTCLLFVKTWAARFSSRTTVKCYGTKYLWCTIPQPDITSLISRENLVFFPSWEKFCAHPQKFVCHGIIQLSCEMGEEDLGGGIDSTTLIPKITGFQQLIVGLNEGRRSDCAMPCESRINWCMRFVRL